MMQNHWDRDIARNTARNTARDTARDCGALNLLLWIVSL